MTTTEPIPALPPLCRAHSADRWPVVIIDSREQTPLRFAHLQSRVGTLTSGDYSAAGLENFVAIERKSAADLVASVTRERDRFERELHRLRGFSFSRVIVTASRESIERGEYRSAATPKSVLASCDTFEVRYGVPFVFVANETIAATLVERWLWLCAREAIKSCNELMRGTESAGVAVAPDTHS
jgi:ERCC4-type nuclease